MHFQVPQYLDIKDKIIGPLTLKQFIVLLVGGAILFLLSRILKFSVFLIIAIPLALITILIAFYRVNHLSFGQFILNLFGFITKPNIYAWKKGRPERPEQEEVPKIIKKGDSSKKSKDKNIPQENELEEAQWKTEI